MANAIVQRLMAQASASRGDVAESVKDNPALQRMMQRMTLASLFKAGGRRCERGADESVKRRIAENSKELGNTK